jgi:hypothetical protein
MNIARRAENELLGNLGRCLLFFTICLGGASPAWAGSKLINVQGKLTDSNNNPISSATYVTFVLYTSSAGGAGIWSSGPQLITPTNGAFNATIGNGITLDTVPFNTAYYLAMQVGSPTPVELSPRQLLGASAYALGSLGNFNVQGNLTSSGSITTNGNIVGNALIIPAIVSASTNPIAINGNFNFTSSTNGIVGVVDGSDAPDGNVGKFITSLGTNVSIAGNGVWTTIASITLTPGDWDLSATYDIYPNGADMGTYYNGMAVSLYPGYPGNTTTDHVQGDTQLCTNNGKYNTDLSMPKIRKSVSAATPIYLKGLVWVNSGVPLFTGRISARRVR